MKIAIRLDDITECMDWPKFLRFKGLLDYYGIKPLIGVIPLCTDETLKGSSEGAPEDFWQYVKDLSGEGWSLAMHGVNHIYTTDKGGLFPLNRFSEFAGLPYEEQLENLAYGVDIFNEHGIETRMFMAPAHSYDQNTLKALKSLGFEALTDGFGNKPYTYIGLTFYPISFRQSSSLRSKKEGYTTFTVHTNTLNDKDFERYEKYFKEHPGKFVSYAEYMAVTPVKRSVFGGFAERFMVLLKRTLVRMI
ncbi:MAG: DUF2334 domain-containing protein [Lachnospiraceae bacterium]|nr:DUF2334 domain-containing protein [Lachnospiraceae bacterium]